MGIIESKKKILDGDDMIMMSARSAHLPVNGSSILVSATISSTLSMLTVSSDTDFHCGFTLFSGNFPTFFLCSRRIDKKNFVRGDDDALFVQHRQQQMILCVTAQLSL